MSIRSVTRVMKDNLHVCWISLLLSNIICIFNLIRCFKSQNIPPLSFQCWNVLNIWQHLKESRFIAMLFIMLKYLFGKQYHPVDVTEPTFFVNKYLSKVGHGNFYSQDMIVAAKIWQFWSHSSQKRKKTTIKFLVYPDSLFLISILKTWLLRKFIFFSKKMMFFQINPT